MALGKARLGQLFYAEGMRSDYDCLHMACAALLSLSWASKRLAIIIGAVSFCTPPLAGPPGLDVPELFKLPLLPAPP